MLQWMMFVVAYLTYVDEKAHREWQRNKGE